MTSPSKKRLRQLARQTLQRFSAEDHKQRSALLVQALAERIKSDFPTITRIACYASLPHEPNLSLLPALLPKIQFYFPLVLSREEITFHLVSDTSTLQTGYFGIPEPDPHVHPSVIPNDLDLILVPGLAFDPKGNRLGQGAGHYDRYLSQIPNTPTIGITYGSQLLPDIPTEPHDLPMTYLASDRGVVKAMS